MLPSWIERRRFTAPAESAVLTFGRRSAALDVFRDGVPKHVKRASLPIELFQGRTRDAESSLAPILKELTTEIAGRYLPLTIALPDAVVHTEVLELDELPKKHSAQLDLARFRLARELGADVKDIAGACQDLGLNGNRRLLLALAIDRQWLQALIGASRAAGLVVWRVTTDACRRFNVHHDRFVAEDKGGALIAVTPEAWSLTIWEDERRPRLLRGRWRDGGNDIEGIAHDAERVILAWVHGSSDRRIARVYLTGEGDDAAHLAELLDARLTEPCVLLEAPKRMAIGT